MSRPPPLKPVPSFKSPNVRLALSDADGLTPRTPHSSRLRTKNMAGADAKSPLVTSGYELDEVDLLVGAQSPDKARLLLPNTAQLEYGPTSSSYSPMRSPWKGMAGGAGGTVTTILTVVFSVVVIIMTGVAVFSPEWLATSSSSTSSSAESNPLMLHPPIGEPVPVLPVPVSQAAPPLMSPAPPTPADDVEFRFETASIPPALAHPTASTTAELAHPTNNTDSYSPSKPDVDAHIISYSAYTSFPLTPHQYAEECWAQLNSSPHVHGSFWGPEHAHEHHGTDVAVHKSDSDARYCSSSITYMLDGTSVGFTAELAVLAQVVGLARERKRPFFIIDKYWNRGSWSDYFEFMPSHGADDTEEPGCLPPPPEELVACPRTARHWVMTFRTAKFHLMHDFSEEFEDPRATSVQRQRPIYERARSSFTSLIRPNPRVQSFVDQARTELLPSPTEGEYLATHMRQGDTRPRSSRYGQQPIPVEEYVAGIEKAMSEVELSPSETPLVVYAASDSPRALLELESRSSESSSYRITSLLSSTSPTLRELVYPRLSGYAQIDWHFGALASSDSIPMDFSDDDDGNGMWTLEERERYTMGMLVDFALISGLWPSADTVTGEEGEGGPAAIVCGMKSTICTTAALGLGFDRAFTTDRGLRWVDIDGRGEIEPVWQPFILAF